MTTRTTLGTLVLFTAFGAAGCIEDAWAQHLPDARPPFDGGPSGLGSLAINGTSTPPVTTDGGPHPGERSRGSTAVGISPPPALANQRFEELTGAGPEHAPRVRLALTRVALRVRGCLLAEHFASTLDVGVHFNLNAAPHAAAVVVDTGHPIARRCLTTGLTAESFPTAAPPVPVSARFRINYGAPR